MSEQSLEKDVEQTGRTAAHVDAGDAGYSKSLKSRHVNMIAIGGAIGTGLFLGAGGRLVDAGPSLFIAYAVCGVFAFLVVRALGELVLYRPSSGAFVSYAREFLGEKGAYTAGWMYFLNWATTGIADITAVAVYTHYWGMFSDVPQWVIALIALAVVLSVNLISVRMFGELEFWFAIIKVGALVVFMCIGIWLLVTQQPVDGHTPGPALITDNGGLFPNGVLPMLLIIQGVVFAYASVELVGVAAGETENPEKIMPKAINSIMWRVGLFYVGSVILLSMLLPWSSYRAGESPFVTVLSNIGVPAAGGIMNLVVLTAAMSSLNSGLYSTGRILRSMAMAGSAPKFTGVMSRSQVPYGGILLTSGICVLGVGLNFVVPAESFEIVLNFAAIGIIATWGMIMICHLLFWQKTERGELNRPSYQLPGSPWTELVTLFFLASVLVLMYLDGGVGRTTVLCLPLIVLALVAGWFGVRRRAAGRREEVTEAVTYDLTTTGAAALPAAPVAAAPVIREPLHAPVAHLVRGGVIEGIHHGSVVVLAADGEVELQLGDIEAAFYPRSALKPVQAVAMLRAGLPLDGELLSLAASSHSGEERHLAGARRILELAGATEDDLGNVTDMPYQPAVRDQWIRDGRGPSRLAQNCSGKHAAMLYTCQVNGWSLDGYLDPDHPLQLAIREIVEDLTGQAVARVTVDGCGAPLFSVSLHGLARALARITTAAEGTPERTVADAVRDHAELASGAGRDVAELMRAVPGLLTKDGFEGVQVAALPDGRAVAVKIADGADRARVPVTAAALAWAGVDPGALAAFAGEALLGGGRPVGHVRPVHALDPPPGRQPA